MTNVVLMAGKGERFREAGYAIPKPLLPVSGKPMILRAVECMPPADRWIFVVREDHMKDKETIDALKSVSKNTIIVVDPNPVGQLSSCLVAKEYYNNDESLFVGACDLGMMYDRARYENIMYSSDAPDMLVFSFTRQPNLIRNPQAWGWLRTEGDLITGVSVKIPLSENCFNDHAIAGSFAFRSGKDFLAIADELIRREIRIKNEFYIDSMIGVAIDMGRSVTNFSVNQYIGWGTPADYEEYRWWEKAVADPAAYPHAKTKPEYQFWKKYFTDIKIV